MKCVYRESLDYTGDDYSVFFFLYPYSLLLGGLSNDSITDDGATRIIPYILSYGTGGLYMIWIHPPTPPPRGSGGGPQTGNGKNQDSRALLSLARAKIPPPESCLSLVYRGFLGGF